MTPEAYAAALAKFHGFGHGEIEHTDWPYHHQPYRYTTLRWTVGTEEAIAYAHDLVAVWVLSKGEGFGGTIYNGRVTYQVAARRDLTPEEIGAAKARADGSQFAAVPA